MPDRAESPDSVSPSSGVIAKAVPLIWGLALCALVTLAAMAVQAVEEGLIGHPYVEAIVIAILLGIAIRAVWEPDRRWLMGIAFSAKQLLEIAVALLGASLTFGAIAASGMMLLGAIVVIVILALGASFGISRALGLPVRLSILIACGNSICGNSAIAAVAPVIGASSDDIISSISFTAILGVIVVLGLPLLIPLMHLSETQYGVLAGMTVYAVPQVLAATVPAGLVSTQIGTLVKLVQGDDARPGRRLHRGVRERPPCRSLGSGRLEGQGLSSPPCRGSLSPSLSSPRCARFRCCPWPRFSRCRRPRAS